ncbi:MAG: hypothetical protein GDA36_06540 [Rhodobacteraceae bacterium]|nr:hypothetical protein [Paracoccaceae bacterium]
MSATAGLWLAVFLSGMYHGVNPGMGWPLAVSSCLMEQRQSALFRSLGALACGHFLAMLVILLPFSAMIALFEYERPIRAVGGVLVIGLGLWLLITKRHPRFLTRVPPSQLTLWSFLIAITHGAALMLVPIYLGLCATEELDMGHAAAVNLMTRNADLILTVAVAHTAAMVLSGGVLAYGVYCWTGLAVLRKGWFNLECIWALSLILVGGLGLWSAVAAP